MEAQWIIDEIDEKREREMKLERNVYVYQNDESAITLFEQN